MIKEILNSASDKKIILPLVYIIYFFCLLPTCIFAFKKPYYNWDMLPYMAIVIKMEHSDINLIHKITYSSAKEGIPSKEYGFLVSDLSQYRKKMASSPVDFYQQLPFYVIKPLYTGLIYLFYKANFSLPASTVLPSIMAYLLIGLLLFYWLSKYFKLLFAFSGGLLLMFSIFMVSIARESTPDCLSAFLMFTAMYFIIEKPSVKLMFLFFLLAIFTRIDNIITCFFILSFLAFSDRWEKRISFKQYFLMLIIMTAIYFSIASIATGYGWNIFYYPTFASSFDLSYKFHTTFLLKEYFALMYSKAITAIVFSHLSTFLFVVLLILMPWPDRFRKFGFDQLFSLLLVLIISVRFILFPDLSDRFYISFYLVIIIILVRRISDLNSFNILKSDSILLK
jgi:hypothetical protein